MAKGNEALKRCLFARALTPSTLNRNEAGAKRRRGASSQHGEKGKRKWNERANKSEGKRGTGKKEGATARDREEKKRKG